MSKEIFRKHPCLEIEVSNLGNVRTTNRVVKCKSGLRHYRGRMLSKSKQTTNKSNTYYYKVSISPEPGKYKNFWVHRLVAETWLENPKKYRYVNHIDSDGCNNNVSNLEWCDNGYNVRQAINRGNYKNVRYINGKSMSEISKELGDSYGHLVYKRLKRGWCLKCAITIPKTKMGGDRTTSMCRH